MNELRMFNINDVKLSGRLTRDPELKYLQNGTALLKIDIAFNRNYKKGGEWQKEVGYIQVTVWGDAAEQCAEYLHKGSPVLASGYIKTGTYQDKEGKNRKTFEIVANKVHNLEKSDPTPQNSPEPEEEEY